MEPQYDKKPNIKQKPDIIKEPVIIIRYFTWLRIFPQKRELTYELCKKDSQATDGWKVISTLGHLEAMDLIEENKMNLAVRNQHGTIWEGEMDLKNRRRKATEDHKEDILEIMTEDIIDLDSIAVEQ